MTQRPRTKTNIPHTKEGVIGGGDGRSAGVVARGFIMIIL
jgi:hypothetical protein